MHLVTAILYHFQDIIRHWQHLMHAVHKMLHKMLPIATDVARRQAPTHKPQSLCPLVCWSCWYTLGSDLCGH